MDAIQEQIIIGCEPIAVGHLHEVPYRALLQLFVVTAEKGLDQSSFRRIQHGGLNRIDGENGAHLGIDCCPQNEKGGQNNGLYNSSQAVIHL